MLTLLYYIISNLIVSVTVSAYSCVSLLFMHMFVILYEHLVLYAVYLITE